LLDEIGLLVGPEHRVNRGVELPLEIYEGHALGGVDS
jgi:hypothetical protein